MIINRNNLTPAIEAAFSDEEKEILMITVLRNNVEHSVSDVVHQFLYYYDGYCYKHDAERLKADIAFIKECNIDYIHQIKALKENIKLLMNPLKYNKRTVKESVSRGQNDGLNVSKRSSDSDTSNYEVSIGKSDTSHLDNTIDQGASSQTNDTGATEQVLKTVSLVDKPESRKQLITNADGSWTVTNTDVPHNVSATINKAEKVLPYTNTTIGQRIAVLHESNYNEDSSGSKEIIKANDSSNSINTSQDYRSNAGTVVVGSENENRIKMLTLKIPRLREEFFCSFADLFYHAGLR